jgi:hypothetical protein
MKQIKTGIKKNKIFNQQISKRHLTLRKKKKKKRTLSVLSSSFFVSATAMAFHR